MDRTAASGTRRCKRQVRLTPGRPWSSGETWSGPWATTLPTMARQQDFVPAEEQGWHWRGALWVLGRQRRRSSRRLERPYQSTVDAGVVFFQIWPWIEFDNWAKVDSCTPRMLSPDFVPRQPSSSLVGEKGDEPIDELHTKTGAKFESPHRKCLLAMRVMTFQLVYNSEL